jgi:hypothetical protein
MNNFTQRATFTRSLANMLKGAALAAPLLLGAVSAHAAEPCTASHAAALDAKLVATAEQGAAPLRRFVERTQTIYQLDMDSAVARADRARATAAQCATSVASRS